MFAIFFGPCMVIDSHQKKFVMNMQLRNSFVRVKPVWLKSQKKPNFVWSSLKTG